MLDMLVPPHEVNQLLSKSLCEDTVVPSEYEPNKPGRCFEIKY